MANNKNNYRISSKVLTREDVERAIRNTKSNRMASKYLGINLITWKKWAKYYVDDNGVSLYEKHNNKSGKGMYKYPSKDQNLMADVVNGKLPVWWISGKEIRERLIADGYLQEKCNRCGYCERRNLDLKVPLILHYRDMNKRNVKLDNIQLLCYNCYFMAVGDVFEKNQIKAMELYDSNRCKKIDLDLNAPFDKQFDELTISFSDKSKIEDNKDEYEMTKEKEEKKPKVIESKEPDKEDTFGDDLISFIGKR